MRNGLQPGLEPVYGAGAPAAPSTRGFDRREAIIPELDQFQRDIIRMLATLFGPMLAGAIIIPLLMLIFSYLGYEY